MYMFSHIDIANVMDGIIYIYIDLDSTYIVIYLIISLPLLALSHGKVILNHFSIFIIY